MPGWLLVVRVSDIYQVLSGNLIGYLDPKRVGSCFELDRHGTIREPDE
jgi:hypothetical protein